MRHVIMEQVFDLLVDNKLDSFTIQQRISTLYRDEILPLLEKLFDDVSTEREMICVERLEIELGEFREEELSRRFTTEKILALIRAQVQEKLRAGLVHSEPGIRVEVEVLTVFRQWIFYMQRGYLPWNASVPDDAWYNKVLEAGATDHQSVEWLRNLIRNDHRLVERIIFQHSPVFLSHLVELLTAEKQQELLSVADELEKVVRYLQKRQKQKDIPPGIRIEHSIWKTFLRVAAENTPAARKTSSFLVAGLIEENFTRQEIGVIAGETKLIKQLITTGATWKELAENFPVKGDKPVERERNRKTRDIEPRQSINEEPAMDEDQGQIRSLTDILYGGKKSGENSLRTGDEETGHLPDEITEEGIFLGQTGLVILHPFLTSFFRNMELINDAAFTGNLAQQQSILLLHYMATGNTVWSEHELLMAKLLCGYAFSEPVDSSIVLEAKHLSGADELLASVIEQWEALKNPSVQALREGFIQRDGKLFSRNEADHLQVERTGIDILLDRLPWSINYVKLPWMKKVLNVEWSK